MAIVAGAFLLLFGAAMVWWLPRGFPEARYTRIAYVFTALGGLGFLIWAILHMLPAGVAAVIFLVLGGIFGIIGFMRKELRVSL
jgi:hypothetical protein